MAKIAVDLSTAGAKIGYAIEATAGTRPTSGYTNIANPKSIPDFNPEPSTLDTTSLNVPAGGYKTYIEGLKDIGGNLGITFGMSQVLLDTWNTDICEAAKTALESGKRTWFVVWIPGLDKSFFFTAIPSELGLPALDVDSVYDATVNLVPTSIHGWDTAVEPTDAE